MLHATNSLTTIIDEWRDNVSIQHQVNTYKLTEWVQLVLSLICCPCIYSYYLIELATLRALYLGGDVKHIFGVTEEEFLRHSLVDSVRVYTHSDDQAALLTFTRKAAEFALEHKVERTLKRTYFYRQITANERTIQVMEQAQILFYNDQSFSTVQLNVLVDVSHIRAPDALPMMTLLYMSASDKPVFFNMTMEPLEVTQQAACSLGIRELEINYTTPG